ncbi:glutathione-regulated potassium-efflux system protein KefB [Artemisia annua]|uniref:Glutathione-regulated potassium-efflux system protein KefB n=1 Tax=Artemisia annua TaxID=35608 RepID=A0A2U1KBE6_ARTAN|nr:glutathione-regulated potassium-efflux system protein KefB [Artemisia annua]
MEKSDEATKKGQEYARDMWQHSLLNGGKVKARLSKKDLFGHHMNLTNGGILDVDRLNNGRSTQELFYQLLQRTWSLYSICKHKQFDLHYSLAFEDYPNCHNNNIVVLETLEPSLQFAYIVLAQAKFPLSEITAINEFRSRHLLKLTEWVKELILLLSTRAGGLGINLT